MTRFGKLVPWMAALTAILLPALVFAEGSGVEAAGHAAEAAGGGHGAGGASLGSLLPVWTVLPFVTLLGFIALMPLTFSHWWEHNKNKGIVVAVLAIPTAAYLVSQFGDAGAPGQLTHAILDYVSFICLLGALFTISGGIYVKGSLNGTPLGNAGLMALGAVLANFIGTTGASMVLIRPMLRANAKRENKAHIVVFFIFIVSNCGGLLTPLGDPPLFLGFLKGVPFAWTLSLWKEWILVNGLVLLIFNFFDQYMLDKEDKERPAHVLDEVMQHEPIGIEGKLNLAFLLGVIALVVSKGLFTADGTPVVPNPFGSHSPIGLQEFAMVGLAAASFFTTPKDAHKANAFGFGPIIEVAVLFAGIFVVMVPPMQILNARGGELGIVHPWQFYWAAGMLSSFLDNAPTYLTFASVAAGQFGIPTDGHFLADLLAHHEHGDIGATLLAAISCGAVMMGANSYIGNGPNFMVKAIAEENGVKMPSFFGYMVYSGAILIPTFIIVTFVFFNPFAAA